MFNIYGTKHNALVYDQTKQIKSVICQTFKMENLSVRTVQSRTIFSLRQQRNTKEIKSKHEHFHNVDISDWSVE